MPDITLNVAVADSVGPESWLRDARFRWFLDGYGYASTQTRAIPALAAVSPEDLYFAVCAVLRGAKHAGHDVDVPEKDLRRLKPERTTAELIAERSRIDAELRRRVCGDPSVSVQAGPDGPKRCRDGKELKLGEE